MDGKAGNGNSYNARNARCLMLDTQDVISYFDSLYYVRMAEHMQPMGSARFIIGDTSTQWRVNAGQKWMRRDANVR
ncbi:hypothetical protein Cmtc_36990 [Cupriavidus sp. TKC]|nr:hypothetical protein Cmtc_36990 [Cupriavidus sp. TKC]